MKLLSAHIQGFGCLTNFDISFQNDLTPILWENGQGKSTLAAFISAMLFGMENPKAGSIERTRYEPFHTKEWGGTLTFSHKGEIYTVAHTFAKRANKDTVALTKGKQTIDLQGQEVGPYLLGISRAAFNRLCLIDDNDLDFAKSADIASHLGQVGGNYDFAASEKAEKALLEASRKIIQAKGHNGLLDQTENRLAQIEADIGQKEARLSELAPIKTEYHALLSQRNELRVKESEAKDAAVYAQKEATLHHLEDEYKTKSQEVVALKQAYHRGFVTAEEAQVATKQSYLLSTPENGKLLSPEQEERYRLLSLRFASGIPSEEEIALYREKADRLASLQASLETSARPLSEKESGIFARFEANHPDEGSIAEIKGKLEEYKRVNSSYAFTDSYVTVEAEPKKINPIPIVLWAVGGVASIAGVILFLFQWIVGLILLVLGLGLVGLAFYVHRKGKPVASTPQKTINPEKETLGRVMMRLNQEISSFLFPYQIVTSDPISGVATFLGEWEIYQSIIQTREQSKGEREKAQAEAESLQRECDEFFAKYQYSGKKPAVLLVALQNDANELRHLSALNAKEKAQQEEQAKARQQAETYLASLRGKYQIEGDIVAYCQEARTAAASYERLVQEEAKAKDAYELYKKENPIPENKGDASSLDELHEALGILDSKIAETKNLVAEENDLLVALDSLRHNREIELDRHAALKRRHKILVAAHKHLESARLEITERFVGPIKERFGKYAKLCEATTGLHIELSTDLELTYLQDGAQRDDVHLSDGEATVVSFCLRLALLESILGTEPIPLLLDDPFLTLDQDHLQKMLKGLGDLGYFQILYLTCHQSRMPQ